jgi:hypothetical protein
MGCGSLWGTYMEVSVTAQRDLASVELWQRSLKRSRSRRAFAHKSRRGYRPRALVGVLSVASLAFAAPAAFADQPPGLLGYEGQPGNQGGQPGGDGGGQPPGLLGYEGQPGNQGGGP